jgi:hypothetical protein
VHGPGTSILSINAIIDALDEMVLQLGLGIQFIGDGGSALGSLLGIFIGQGVLLSGHAMAEGVFRGD